MTFYALIHQVCVHHLHVDRSNGTKNRPNVPMSSPTKKKQRLEESTFNKSVRGGAMAEVSPTKSVFVQTDKPNSELACPEATLPIKGPIINENAQGFERIVNMPGFVDRSLFLKELLNQPNMVMIFAPTKFGKTLNLSMAALFFGIERDGAGKTRDIKKDPTPDELNDSAAMKVFRRGSKDEAKWCKILEDRDFVNDHFGRHPIVRLDLKKVAAEDKSSAIYGCALLLQAAYDEHEYLTESAALRPRVRSSCQIWINYSSQDLKVMSKDTQGAQELNTGFENLILSLRVHWQRDPILLVDEIDYPTTKAISSKVEADNIKSIGSTISDMVCRVVKETDHILAAALITGISYVGSMGLSNISNTVPPFHLQDLRFSEYYGLTEKEMERLLMHNLENEVDRKKAMAVINDFYNGYTGGGKRYCLFSVLSYIESVRSVGVEKAKLIFWNQRGMFEDIAHALKDSELMEDVYRLKAGESIPIVYSKKTDGTKLLGIYNEENMLYRDTFFSYLCDIGICAYDSAKQGRLELEEVYIKIPNQEVKSQFTQMFAHHYTSMGKVMMAKRKSAGRFFQNIIPYVKNSDAAFVEDLDAFFEDLKAMVGEAKCQSEIAVNSLVWSAMNDHANKYDCLQEYRLCYEEGKGKDKKTVDKKIDLWMKKKGESFAVIWEFKYRQKPHTSKSENGHSALAAMEDIVCSLETRTTPSQKQGDGYVRILSEKDIKWYLLVGLSVDCEYKPQMYVFANSKDWDKDLMRYE